MPKNRAAVSLGRKGGASTSTKKADAARKNGLKGGRPKKPHAATAFVEIGRLQAMDPRKGGGIRAMN